jgi:hypothetical protein
MKMTIYLNILPTDLLELLFLYISKDDMLTCLNLENAHKLLDRNLFWETVWNRDISSLVPIQHPNYPKYHERYQYVLKQYQTLLCTKESLDYLAANGYDILLYEMFSRNRDIPLLQDLHEYILVSAAIDNHLPIMQKMIDFGANDTMMALIQVAGSNSIEALDFLVNQHLRLYPGGSVDFSGLLNLSAYFGCLSMSKRLIELGANHYNWALHNAVTRNNVGVIKLLLEKEATNYDECIQLAENNNRKDIADIIKSYKDR